MAGPRILAVCAGVGGIELGLRLVYPDARLVAAIEREACAAAHWLARMEDQSVEPAPVFCGDLADFPGRQFRGCVDILTAGLPCQPWSTAGKRKGHADERAIGPQFADLVEAVRPSVVFLENVPQFVSGGFFEPLVLRLCELGYTIEDPLFLRASDVGAPHRRERVFILAHTEGGHRGLPGDRRRAGDEPAGSGEAVADAGCQRRQQIPRGAPRNEEAYGREGWGEQDTDHLAAGPGAAVADSHGAGREERRCQRADDGEELSPFVGGSPPLGHTEGDNEQRDRTSDGRPEVTPRRPGCFPPGPADHEAWAELLAERPDLAPAVSAGSHWGVVETELRRGLRSAIPTGNRRQRRIAAARVAATITARLREEETQPSLRRASDELAGGLDESPPTARADRLRMGGNGVVAIQSAVAYRVLCGAMLEA